MYPTTQLQPGSTGSEVVKLQTYLVSLGLLTQAQMNTGPGTYGPATTAAVKALQQRLGVDNSSGPGYWGPKTIAAVGTKTTTPPAPAPTVTPSVPTNTPTIGTPSDASKNLSISLAGGSTSSTTPSPAIVPPPTTSAFKGTAAYKALPQELKDLVDLGFSAFTGTAEQQKIFSDALTQAKDLADPYAKSQLALANAEFSLAIAKTTKDYETQKNILTKTRQDIADELASNKEFLSLEQQAEMAKELKGYDTDLLDIADQAAEKGITFATGARSRSLAEERRATQFQDVVQSSQRKYNFQIKDLEMRASRGDTEAQQKLDEANTNKGFDLTKIGQNAEKVLGSAGASGLGLPGFTATGGALGDIEQQRRESIISLAGAAISK